MNNNNEEFIRLYNELDSFIDEKYDRYEEDSSIYFLINRFRKSSIPIEKEYAKKLDSIRKIRNLYVHESGIIDDLFLVSDEVILTLKEIINYVKDPLIAKDIMTSFNYLKLADDETNIDSLISIIYKEGISNIPYINDKHIVKGVFNSDVLLNLHFHNVSLSKNTKVKDIKEYLTFEANFNSRFIFVNENYEIDVLNEYFNNSKELYKKRLPIIFVTSSGRSDGILKGIISPIDLIKNSKK